MIKSLKRQKNETETKIKLEDILPPEILEESYQKKPFKNETPGSIKCSTFS